MARTQPQRVEQEQAERNQRLLQLLQDWRAEGDEKEQRETLAFLQRSLNDDRLSNRDRLASS